MQCRRDSVIFEVLPVFESKHVTVEVFVPPPHVAEHWLNCSVTLHTPVHVWLL